MRPRFDIVPTAAIVVSIGALFAPLGAIVSAAETTPYQATVVADKVEVRAGYSRTFYVVGELRHGDTVTVAEEPDGWYKIAPPSGIYSIISKGFVDARGDGKTGVVNSDSSIVKAAASDPNEFSYREQTRLKKGDTVRIVGEQGSFYKIVPPQGAFVFLPPESVKANNGAAAAPPTPAPPAPAAAPTPEPTPAPAPEVKPSEPAPKPEAAAPTETETPIAPKSKPKSTHREEAAHAAATETPAPFESSEPAPKPAAEPTPPPAPSAPRPARPESPALQDAENKLVNAGKLPLTEQPLEELLATYQGLSNDSNLSLVDRRIIAVRLGQLHRNIEIAKGLKALDDAKTASSETIELPKAEQPPEGVYNPSRYDLVGQLLSSGVYNGETGPRLYRLVEPASMRTLAYVQAGRLWSPRTTLGRIVGIMGETRFDPALKLRIVEVKKMDVLEATGKSDHAPAASSSGGSSGSTTPASPTTAPSVSGASGGGASGARTSGGTTQPAKGETTELMK